jgi:very-short-patch-repair endonuclease
MKRRFKYRIASWLNYHIGTHFLESESERVVYDYLKKHWHVKRQVKIGQYRADFVLPGNIVIEVDGVQHFERKSYDNKRDRYLESFGYSVIRIASGGLWTQERDLILLSLGKEIKRLTK